jgi:hypothetical protein
MRKLDINIWDIILSQRILSELNKGQWSKIRRFKCECLNCWKVTDKYITSLIQSKTGCMCTHWKWSIKKEPKRSKEEKRMYTIWTGMRQRCYNKKYNQSYLYWDRWITMSNEWKDNFEQFYKDMWDKPEWMSIDRIDWNKWYSKDNCRWATIYEQNNNRSNNIMIGWFSLSEWCIYNNICHSRAYRLVKKWLTEKEILDKLG